MRIEHVIPSLQSEDSGPTQVVRGLCESLAKQGLDVRVITAGLDAPMRNVPTSVHPSVAWHAHAFSPNMVLPIRRALHSAQIVHNHGLWGFPNAVVGLAKQPGRAALVSSTHGNLAPAALRFSKWRKQLLGPLYRPVLDRADCLHATGLSELANIREAGLTKPVAVIPSGIEVPPSLDRAAQRGDRRRLLYLGRIHPIKGVELLLDAWAGLQRAFPDWELVVAGKGEPAYERSVHDHAERQRLERVTFPGAVYGKEKMYMYQSASLFILPTQSENFGVAVAEALANGVPVITTRGAPWADLKRNLCGFWVERTQDAVAESLVRAMALSEKELCSMGERGRQWMLRDYDWPIVARRTAAVYRWLVDGGSPPSDVRLSE